jgi:carbamate kinase
MNTAKPRADPGDPAGTPSATAAGSMGLLLIATDVSAVFVDWGLPGQRALRRVSPAALQALHFAAGSMAPKVQPACAFVRRTGGRTAIGSLDQIEGLLAGTAGTQLVADAAATA